MSGWIGALVRATSLLAGLLVLLAMPGCATGVSMIAPGQPKQYLAPGSNLLPTGNLDYHVGPLDTLQVEIYPAAGRSARLDYGSQVRIDASLSGGAYMISPGDTLSLEINAETDTTSQVAVRPDGMITLPRLSRDIRAAGRTPAELKDEVTAAYSATLRAPQVTIGVVNSSEDQLSRVSGQYQVGLDGQVVVPGLGSFPAVGRTATALAGQIGASARQRFQNPVTVSASIGQLTGRDTDPRVDPNGRAYFRGPLKVSPDGTIHIPPAGNLPVQGLTLAEVRQAAVKALQRFYANQVNVSVSMADSPSMAVFIGGEVRQPGRYAYSPSMTLLRLITLSGWVTDVGDMTRVLLLHPTSPSHYNVYRSNLREVLENAAIGQDLAVGPQDMVVVPMTYIGQVDQVIDQYIRKIIPINVAATYSYISNPVGNNTVGTTSRVTQ